MLEKFLKEGLTCAQGANVNGTTSLRKQKYPTEHRSESCRKLFFSNDCIPTPKII